MTRSLKQLWLLLRKNLIIVKRAIAWTLFELVLPIAILSLCNVILWQVNDSKFRYPYPGMSFPTVPITGGAEDSSHRFNGINLRSSCYRKMAYCGDSPGLDNFMKLFAARYKGLHTQLEVESFPNKDEMLKKLKNESFSHDCFYEYVGGVVFKNYDTSSLDYEILMSSNNTDEGSWQLSTSWEDFACGTYYGDFLPSSPPYWTQGFLSFQHALDSIFIQSNNITSSGNQTYHVELQRLPEPSCVKNYLASVVKCIPLIWAILFFCTVVHSGREIAQEKQTVKSFLSVMGLQTSMFYLSHILFSWIKIALVILICGIPVALKIKEVNLAIFLIVCLLYGLGVVSFSILCSAPFKSPNTVLKVTIVLWMISAGLGCFQVPSLDNVFYCFLVSLNINHAFQLAVNVMVDFMRNDDYLGFSSLFANGTARFTIGHCIIMIIFDAFLMLALALLIDKCVEKSDWSFRSIFRRDSVNLVPEEAADPGFAHEADNGLLGTVPDIEIEGVIKVWSATGERAVDGLNLKAYRGQVTVLLGHNGAGKSTTFSMVAGLVKPTSGKLMLCQKDASKGGYHDNVGYCPQGNALFDRLTVDEHLWFVHGLKGAEGDYSLEANQLLSDLQLLPKLHELSKNLSGGMKRKLCVCMALIRGSRVVLLDEPTAGMDPGSRYDVEHMMSKIKGDRTFLLTTHYMDEAERLGDRVFIMANGRVVCSGSTNFLKGRVGSGYVLTIVTRDEVDASLLAAKILDMAKLYVKEAAIGDVHAKQLEIKLPKDMQHRFPDVFAQLEQMQDELGITGFGLSLNSLEQVFLKVGEEIEKKNETTAVMEKNARDELIESQMSERYNGFCLLWSQFIAVLHKRFLYSIRNWSQLITQIIVPLMILVLVAWTSKTNAGELDSSRNLSVDQFGPSRVIYQNDSRGSSASIAYRSFIRGFKIESKFEVEETNAYQNVRSTILNFRKSIPRTGFGALFNNSNIKVLFNIRALHSLPVSLNAVNNARLRAIHPEGSIKASVFSYHTKEVIADMEKNTLEKRSGFQTIIAATMFVLLSLVTSATVVFFVTERTSKFVHQQVLTGVSPIVFWIGSFFYDMLIFILACTSFLIVFIIAEWQKDFIGYVAMLWLFYFLASTPFIYVVSRIFSSPSKANVLLVIFQIIMPLLAMVAAFFLILILFFLGVRDFEAVYNVIEIGMLLFLPSFCLGKGMNKLAELSTNTTALTAMGINDSSLSASRKISKKFLFIMDFDILGKPVMCMSIFAVVTTVIFIAFQFKFVQQSFSNMCSKRSRQKTNEDVLADEDDDVRRERTRVEESHGNEDCSMVVQGLTKMFGRICALDNLTLAVKRRECFGLLGVNGAGKTTTFDILTGLTFPTFGSATLDGRNVVDQIAIGYCPQFDAIMLDYTGREILQMLARLHGFVNFKEKADIVLRAVGMEEQGNKLIKYYSGGQRRKISVGIALLAVTKMIILDEPTAGIDPMARRHIWSVLTYVRDKSDSAQLLTSHSMDECEALCSRIAVLNKGRMIAIGTSQWLKSKFGNNFTLTIVDASVDTREHSVSVIGNNFPNAVLKTDAGSSSLTLKWQIARTKNAGLVTDSWSKMFGHCQKLAADLKATDFCLAQASLEDTFLTLSKGTNPPQ